MKCALAAIAAFLLTIALLTLAGLANPSSAQTTALRCFGLPPTHIGTSGSDTIVGTRQTDVIWAGGGNDLIIGKGGSDLICGGPGNDRIRSGAGNDLISGGPGYDRCNGGRGAGDFATDCEKARRVEKDRRPAKTPTPPPSATVTTTTRLGPTTTTSPPRNPTTSTPLRRPLRRPRQLFTQTPNLRKAGLMHSRSSTTRPRAIGTTEISSAAGRTSTATAKTPATRFSSTKQLGL